MNDYGEEKTEEDEMLKETPRIDVKFEIAINDNIKSESKGFSDSYSDRSNLDKLGDDLEKIGNKINKDSSISYNNSPNNADDEKNNSLKLAESSNNQKDLHGD
jgi:hypothetical protein